MNFLKTKLLAIIYLLKQANEASCSFLQNHIPRQFQNLLPTTESKNSNRRILYNQKKAAFLIVLFISCFSIYSQEKLLSTTESYFDFLALDGFANRPYLNYRTLSDSKWIISDTSGNIWKQNAEIAGSQRNKSLKIYAPELYSSYNEASPHGQNDGLLWQGKGFNFYLSAGARFEKNGFEFTFKPEIAFSSNQAFDLISPDSYYSGSLYEGKADTYGYYGVASIDAPQRFGNKPFFTFGWGDSEIRYSIKSFTIGLGTQYIWLGPAKINPVLHSNNAPSYPKIDVGIRRTTLRLFGRELGDVEGRLWIGRLSESDFFDNDSKNNYTFLSGLSLAYEPSFLKGFTLLANRTFLCPWKFQSLLSVLDLPLIRTNTDGGRDEWDQRASIGFDYLLPVAGFEVYAEMGINDYSPSIDGYVRYPFHSMVYTAGLRKSIRLSIASQPLRGEILFEISNLEVSQDFQFQWPSTFYAHHQITQGYTNKGQWLGAGNGTGGNSQYLGFKVYHPKGNVNAFIHRSNPDNDHIYRFSIGTPNNSDGTTYIHDFKAILSVGLGTVYYIRSDLRLFGGLSYVVEHNPLYNAISWSITSKRHSLRLEAGLAYCFQ